MTSRWLWKVLVLPLGAAAAALFALHFVWPLGGFWLNLSASLVTIVLTVVYVDGVLAHHEELRWQRPAALIGDRATVAANTTITGIRSALGFPSLALGPTDLRTTQTEYARYCADRLEPGTERALFQLDVEGWKALVVALKASYSHLETLLNLFGSRFDPEQLAILIEAQDHLRSGLLAAETFPDLMGLQDELLSSLDPGTRMIRDENVRWASREIRATLASARRLIEHELTLP